MKYTRKETPPAIPTIDEANADPGGSGRWKLLALVAPGLIAIEAGPAPWAIEANTVVRPRLVRALPGCSPLRPGKLVQAAPAADAHFSTKARSMT